MKTIGLIGGMSWESSAHYYKIINEVVKERLGSNHSAQCLMYSVEFAEIMKLQKTGEWEKLSDIMIEIAQKLEKGGADFIIICANTMHKMFPEMQSNISIPILHIADVTATRIKNKGLKKVALLGTNYVMTQDFYKSRLADKHQLEIIIPKETHRDIIHNIIFDELIKGEIREESRKIFSEIISHMQKLGAEGVILGCTEIPLLIQQKDSRIPIFNTTEIHAEEAVNFALI